MPKYNDRFHISGNKLIWENDGEQLCVEPWGDNSLRVRSVMMSEFIDSDFALLPLTVCKPEISITEERAYLVNGKIKAVIENSGKISYYNQNGKLLFREADSHGALKISARKFKPIIGGDYKLTATFEADDSEKLYGMGQYQQPILNIKHCNFELAQRNSQASVPFVLSSKGYGFLWHNPAIGRVSFGKNTTEWYADSSKQLDYWLCAGDTPAQIEEAYAKVTGTVPMMPEYGLGFWQCKLRYSTQEELLSVAREYKRRKLPIDVIVLDFFHWPKQGEWKFDKEFFPNPKAMVDELKEMGIELMVSIWPTVDLSSENFQEMKQKGYLVKPEMGVNVTMQFGGDTVFYDATNPKARDYVWKISKRNYYDIGIRTFWLDEAEPEYLAYDFDNYRYHMGPNVQVGNIYPKLYSKTFYDGMKNEGQQNIINLVRCAWAGSQRYGALVWSGDIASNFETFRNQICAGLHMGIAGIPWWTTDIGGFYGGNPKNPDFRELLIRWFQYGAFSPVMRLHGDRIPSTPIMNKDGKACMNTGGPNEVWSFGEETYEILKKYLFLREKLRPYTRTLMAEAHEKGTPVMRTMFYEFPQDEACWESNYQYMFGSDILVAPITEKDMRQRTVYLPEGASWTYAHDGKTYTGGQSIVCEAPIETIPVFLRDGKQGELIGQL